MRCRIDTQPVIRGLILLAAAWACFIPSFSTAAPATAEATGTAISGDTAQAILQELKGIRQVLEKIERQGLAQPARRPATPRSASVPIGRDDTILGAPDAPVTVVEFTDYQCPYCKRFVQSTFPQLKRDFIDTGKVRWVVHDLPLAFHSNARKAAQAAHCAAEQGKFWEMRATLYRNNTRLGSEQLPVYAREIGLDGKAFSDCLASDRHLAQIDQDSQEASRIRITGTPSFIIGKTTGDTVSGRLVIGAQAPAVFRVEIQRVLEQSAAGKTPPEKNSTANQEPVGSR